MKNNICNVCNSLKNVCFLPKMRVISQKWNRQALFNFQHKDEKIPNVNLMIDKC